MKKTMLALMVLLAASAALAIQNPGAATKATVSLKAINYRHSASAKIDFRGTELMQRASGEAKVQSRPGRIEVELKVLGMEDATKFGLEYLTYVLWAISPQGRAVNMGELVLDKGASKIRATTEMQTFGMIVTAEPYFAVTQPSSLVVLVNALRPDSTAREEEIGFSYELLGREAYASVNERIKDAIFGIDPRTPLELFEARNAVRIARAANADKYAGPVLQKAEQLLLQAESSYRQKQNRASIATYARDAAQTAEDARVMSVKKQEQERAERDAAEREARARAQAQAESERRRKAEEDRAQAEEDRAKAEAARQEAERLKQEAEAAAQQAAQAKAEADAARAAALQQQQALAAEAEKARQAASEADRLRQQAEKEKTELRARLLQQLNSILETKDTARGLISNMGDVLFQTGKYELKPAARESLAKVSGILLAYPSLKVAVEGHTDSVGSDEYNQRLSEQRAEAVRQYFLTAGIGSESVTARGFGKLQPVASNDTPEGRQRNRRVELVLSGEAIGGSDAAKAAQ